MIHKELKVKQEVLVVLVLKELRRYWKRLVLVLKELKAIQEAVAARVLKVYKTTGGGGGGGIFQGQLINGTLNSIVWNWKSSTLDFTTEEGLKVYP